MDAHSPMIAAAPWTLTIPEPLFGRLQVHLFRGDHDEHGAVMLAGVTTIGGRLRLLARELYLAKDGADYVAGVRGYRMLKGEFIQTHILRARDERLVYLAIHNHGGGTRVGFSRDDLASQERGYPALLDVAAGMPVGALVVAEQAVAGNLWFSPMDQVALTEARIVGLSCRTLAPEPRGSKIAHQVAYDRQSRLFGDAGQAILTATSVGVIGAGGVGSLLVEYLARLGVGRITVVDPDRVDITNLPRLVDATAFDARTWLTADDRPEWLRKLGKRFAARKVDLCARVARRANRHVQVETILGDIADARVARRFLTCDFLFLAADTMQARLVFNAIVTQYLIPGWQAGSKVVVEKQKGKVHDVYSVVRPVLPGRGCLFCNELISAAKLQEEALTAEERAKQRYVDDPFVAAPSVITLNAVAAAQAANDFLFACTGLAHETAETEYHRFLGRERSRISEEVQQRPDCSECSTSDGSRFARGDARRLPTRSSRESGRNRSQSFKMVR
jgi:hypothetical protein